MAQSRTLAFALTKAGEVIRVTTVKMSRYHASRLYHVSFRLYVARVNIQVAISKFSALVLFYIRHYRY